MSSSSEKAPAPSSRLPRALLVLDVLCLALVGWLYGRDVSDYLRAKTAPIAAMTELPRLWYALLVVIALVGVTFAVVQGLVQKRDRTYRGYRLPPILLAVALFVDVLALSGQRFPISSADQSAIALNLSARALSQLVNTEGVPVDANAIASVIRSLGPPPFLVHGARPDHFAVQVRTGCEEPVGEAPGVEPGTMIYCATKDRRRAWLTLVGLPAEKRFGEAEMFSKGGLVQVSVVDQPQPDEEEPGEHPESPLQPSENDGGQASADH